MRYKLICEKPTFHFRWMWPFGLGAWMEKPARDVGRDWLDESQDGPWYVSWKLSIGPLFFAGTLYIPTIVKQK